MPKRWGLPLGLGFHLAFFIFCSYRIYDFPFCR